MPRTGPEPPFEQGLVEDREIERKARGRGGEYRQEKPALPIVPRARGQKDEGDEEPEPEHALCDRLSIEGIHEYIIPRLDPNLHDRSTRMSAIADYVTCLLYTSDAADERSSVDLGGRRIIK